MRPPSYYASIVKSNSNHYSSTDFDTSTASSSSARSSHALRSSLSSPSSASYASRSHLPYVAQSALVAHCFTSSSSAGYSARSHRASPSSLSSGSSYSSSGSLSSRPPSTKRAGHLNHTSSPYSSSSTRPLSYLRPSCLTTSASSASGTRSSYHSSSRPSYRPISASTYYQPIRLRERPLLPQISSALTQRHSSALPKKEETIEKPRPGVEKDKVNQTTIRPERKENEDPDGSWSSDITRNISRNKYLIKFREIDKRPTPVSQSTEGSANWSEEQQRGRESTVPDREQSSQRSTLSPTLEVPEGYKDGPEKSEMKIADAGAAVHERDESMVDEEKSEIRKRRLVVKSNELESEMAVATEPVNEAEQKGSMKKERRNVKLKLKPLVNKTKEPEVMEKLTPKITSAKPPSLEAENKKTPENVAKNEETSVSESPIKEQTKLNTRPAKRVITRTSKLANDEQISKESSEKVPEDQAVKKGDEAQPQTTATKVLKKLVRKSSEPKLKSPKSGDSKQLKTRKSADKQVSQAPNEEQTQLKEEPKVEEVRSPPVKRGGRIRCRAYNYDDFNFLTVLGHGGWGFVILAELKEHEACFAVKCIKKITIVEDDDYDSIMIERKVLALGNLHPFICKLFCTFETEGYLFFVMEYCAGGDLMFHVQREGKFAEPRCRFYAAEIICAIRFLHNRHIIYRDLKLDNILLDTRGHVRLVDFGMCQCRTYREEMLPSNFCGTPEYISPEIIKGVPYNHSVDWWSFGVLLYEMAVGKMPFRGNDENELLWNVCYEQIHYPMFLTKELTSLLKLLLEREPSKRMGMATCKAGDIYDQPFFRSVDWKAVEELRVPPPFVPEVNSNRDVQNFDSDFTESACELSPVDKSTLDKIDQKQFEKFPYTNPDIFIFDQPAAAGPTFGQPSPLAK